MPRYPGICKADIIELHAYPFHVERDLCIFHILEGGIQFSDVCGTQTLHAGQTEIINVKEPVALMPEGESARLLWFSFDPAFLTRYDMDFETITFNCNIVSFFSSLASAHKIHQLNIQLLRILQHMQDHDAFPAIQTLADEILRYLLKHFTDVSNMYSDSGFRSESEERFCRINRYMIEHVTERISLKDVAEMEFLSVSYLSREFSSKLKKTFTSVMNYYRIVNAVIWLLDTDDSLTYIAENSGFSSVRYFHETFKSYLKCTPAQFRSQAQSVSPILLQQEITDADIDAFRAWIHKAQSAIPIGTAEITFELTPDANDPETGTLTIRGKQRDLETLYARLQSEYAAFAEHTTH